jgi:Fe-S-cluster containining protein
VVFHPIITGEDQVMTQECRQCGKCCEKWGWDQKGIPEDIIPWIEGDRQDILTQVLIRFKGGRYATAGGMVKEDLPRIDRIYYWVDPDGKKRDSCPFFERRDDGRVYCRIHDTKPAVCVGFAPWAEIWHDYGLNCPACRDTAP